METRHFIHSHSYHLLLIARWTLQPSVRWCLWNPPLESEKMEQKCLMINVCMLIPFVVAVWKGCLKGEQKAGINSENCYFLFLPFCLVAVNDPKIALQLFNSWTAIWISRMKVPCGSLGRSILGRVAFGLCHFYWPREIFTGRTCFLSGIFDGHKEENTSVLLSKILRICLSGVRHVCRTFFQRRTYIWMPCRHMKRCLTSLIIRAVQVRTTSVRIAIIKMTTNNMPWGYGEKETQCTVVRM